MIRTVSLLSMLALALVAASTPKSSVVPMPTCDPCPFVK